MNTRKAPSGGGLASGKTAAEIISAGAGRPEQLNGAPLRSAAERHALIAEAAFFRAARRGFVDGGELEDWLAAEREIDGMSSRR